MDSSSYDDFNVESLANIRSIRTFWSPELKKERNTRKEEQNRATRLENELRSHQDERPENILLRENNVLRRAVADLEGMFLYLLFLYVSLYNTIDAYNIICFKVQLFIRNASNYFKK